MRNSSNALRWALVVFLVGCGSSTPGGSNPPRPDAGGAQNDGTVADLGTTDTSSPADAAADVAAPQEVSSGLDTTADVSAVTDTGGSGGSDTAADLPGGDGVPPGLKAVMITNPGNALTPGDKIMSDRLKSRGFVVDTVSDAAVTTMFAASHDLIVISSSAESAPLGTKVRDVTVPVVSIENGEYSPMRMSGANTGTDSGMLAGQTAVTITMPNHPLAAGLTGTVTISSMAGELGWGVPAPSAVIVATLTGNPARAAVFGYAAGAAMVGGQPAPARRVGYAVREALAANLTADGLKLFDAAVTWALSK